MKRTAMLAALLLAAGCAGRAEADPSMGASKGAGGSTALVGGAGTSSGATWAGAASDVAQPPAVDLVCPTQEPRNSQMFASPREKAQALVGSWLQCSTNGIGPDDAAGIAITSDGKFTILIRDAAGAIVPGVGVLHEGRVEIAEHGAVLFAFAGLTEHTSMLVSDEVPYRMYAFNTDFIGYDYVR